MDEFSYAALNGDPVIAGLKWAGSTLVSTAPWAVSLAMTTMTLFVVYQALRAFQAALEGGDSDAPVTRRAAAGESARSILSIFKIGEATAAQPEDSQVDPTPARQEQPKAASVDEPAPVAPLPGVAASTSDAERKLESFTREAYLSSWEQSREHQSA